MSTADPQFHEDSENPRVISPFAQTTSTVQNRGGGKSTPWALWIVSSLLILLVLAIVGYFTMRYVSDPYRKLEPFKMDKYLSDYHSMTGNKFQADLTVAADLGYKAEVGRLMKFTLANDSRSIVVLIPPGLSNQLYFTKGQNYQASLEVDEKGLIYADSCEKE